MCVLRFWTFLAHTGTYSDMDPSVRKRVVLTNVAAIFFSITIALLGFTFALLNLDNIPKFCAFFSVFLLTGVFLNYLKKFYLASVVLLLISVILGTYLCALIGKESMLHQGLYVLCAAPWLFFSRENRITALFLSISPLITYTLLHVGYLDSFALDYLTGQRAKIVHGLSNVIFMTLISSLFFYLVREHIIAEDLMKDYRGKSIQAAKLASLGEMAGGIAHEINNPLAIISSSASFIKKASTRGKLTDEMLKDNLDQILSTLDRVANIISGLRNVSRDSKELKKTQVETKSLMGDVLGLCSEKFKENGVHLESNLDAPEVPVKIYCDQVQLSQTILNLLGNAYDAVAEKDEKWVRIKVFEDAENTLITVTDSGEGISKENLSKIFNPFFTSKPIGKGTGLGLSVSKGIIERHGGSLSLDKHSEYTKFIIQLPKFSGGVTENEES